MLIEICFFTLPDCKILIMNLWQRKLRALIKLRQITDENAHRASVRNNVMHVNQQKISVSFKPDQLRTDERRTVERKRSDKGFCQLFRIFFPALGGFQLKAHIFMNGLHDFSIRHVKRCTQCLMTVD